MSSVKREYVLECGQPGKDAYDAGVWLNIAEAQVYYVLGLSNVVMGGSLRYINDKYSFNIICEVGDLTSTQIAQLDAFMNGVNNTVIGTVPVRLLNPPVSFMKIAYSIEDLHIIRQDLEGRGLGRQLSFYNGNNLEYWSDVSYSAGNKNQLANMWKARFLDASTNRSL